VGRDPSTGLPILKDARSILPLPSADDGAAVSVLAVDIDGDDDLDLIITDVHGGSATRRTRVWRQDR